MRKIEKEIYRKFIAVYFFDFLKQAAIYLLQGEVKLPTSKEFRDFSRGRMSNIIDEAFVKNKLLVEKVKLILTSSEEEIKKKKYILTDEKGR